MVLKDSLGSIDPGFLIVSIFHVSPFRDPFYQTGVLYLTGFDRTPARSESDTPRFDTFFHLLIPNPGYDIIEVKEREVENGS